MIPFRNPIDAQAQVFVANYELLLLFLQTLALPTWSYFLKILFTLALRLKAFKEHRSALPAFTINLSTMISIAVIRKRSGLHCRAPSFCTSGRRLVL
jgi:hypothetical protein